MSQDNVVIVSGVRTPPMGGFMGSLAPPVSAPELAQLPSLRR